MFRQTPSNDSIVLSFGSDKANAAFFFCGVTMDIHRAIAQFLNGETPRESLIEAIGHNASCLLRFIEYGYYVCHPGKCSELDSFDKDLDWLGAVGCFVKATDAWREMGLSLDDDSIQERISSYQKTCADIKDKGIALVPTKDLAFIHAFFIILYDLWHEEFKKTKRPL